MSVARFAIVREDLATFALPRNEVARRFCAIARRNFLTEEDIYHIRKIGVKIEIELDEEPETKNV